MPSFAEMILPELLILSADTDMFRLSPFDVAAIICLDSQLHMY